MSKESMKEARRLWVEALRSGEYEQGNGALCDDGKYCCLGVACDLFIKGGHGQLTVTTNGQRTLFNGQWSYTPSIVMKWLGLRTDAGSYDQSNSLAHQNDGHVPFSKIADIIESEPEGLFVAEAPNDV